MKPGHIFIGCRASAKWCNNPAKKAKNNPARLEINRK